MQLLVAIVAYEAASCIERLLDRIPAEIAGLKPTVLVADDCSSDQTEELSKKWAENHPERLVEVIGRDRNLGYGGNQKACYRWAQEHGFDIVVLLHGDEQYPPEQVSRLVAPILDGSESVVFGSRMIDRGGARRGGMPIDRFIGNRVLTRALNALSGAHLTEWFSGYRAYRMDVLASVALEDLPDGFDFDTAIMVDLLHRGVEIREVSMPTRYGEEISRVPLLRTGLSGLRHGLRGWWRGARTHGG